MQPCKLYMLPYPIIPSQANLTKEKERELNDAIQAYFKDWLSSSNMLRQIYDLSNLEKDEGVLAAAAGNGGPSGSMLAPGSQP